MRVPAKKKRKNHSRKQASESGHNRSRMGSDPYKEYIFQWEIPSDCRKKGKKRALIAVGHSQLTSVYLMLSTGARYHELGAQYVQAKIERKRKNYLKAELQKLGFEVSLSKMQASASWCRNIKAEFYWKHPSPFMKLVSTAKHQRLWPVYTCMKL